MQPGQARPAQLSEVQVEILRKHPHCLQLGGRQFVLYNLVEKESASGLFKNERLLVLNTREESIGYCSKAPEGLIPFEKEEEVKGHEKETVRMRDKSVKCELVDGVKLVLKAAGEKELQWVFHFGSMAVAKEWFRHLNLLTSGDRKQIDAEYHYVPPPPVPFDQISQLQQHSTVRGEKKADHNTSQILKELKGEPEVRMIELQQTELASKDESAPSQLVYNRNRKPRHPLPPSGEEHYQPNRIESIPQIQQIESEKGESNYEDFNEDTPLGTFVKGDTPSRSHHQSQVQHIKPVEDKGQSHVQERKAETNRSQFRRKSLMAESHVQKGLDDHGHSPKQSMPISREQSLIEEVVRLSSTPHQDQSVAPTPPPLQSPPSRFKRQVPKTTVPVPSPPYEPSHLTNGSHFSSKFASVGGSLEKHILLSEEYLSLGRKQDALRELQWCVSESEAGRSEPQSPYFRLLLRVGSLKLSMSDGSGGVDSAMTLLRQLQQSVESQGSYRSEQSVHMFLSGSELLLRACQLSRRESQLWEVGLLCLQRCMHVESVNVCSRMLKVLLYPLLKSLEQRERMCLLMLVESVQHILDQGGWSQKQLYQRLVVGTKLLNDLGARLGNYSKAIETLWEEVARRNLLNQLTYNPNQIFQGWGSSRNVDSELRSFIIDWLVLVALVGRGFFRVILADGPLY